MVPVFVWSFFGRKRIAVLVTARNFGNKPSKVECSIFQLQFGVHKFFIKTTPNFLLNTSVISFNLTLESRHNHWVLFEPGCRCLEVNLISLSTSEEFAKECYSSLQFNVMRWGARERIGFPSKSSVWNTASMNIAFHIHSRRVRAFQLNLQVRVFFLLRIQR